MSRFLDESDESAYTDPYERHDLLSSDDDGGFLPDQEPTKNTGRRIASVIAVVLSLVVIVGGGYFTYTHLIDRVESFGRAADYDGPGDQNVVVTIESGSSLTEIGHVLYDADVVASVRAFQRAADNNPDSMAIQPGAYQMRTKMAARLAVDALLDPANRLDHQFTVVEGLRNSQVVSSLADQTAIDSAEFEAILNDPAELNLPEWARGATEGFLYPETYGYSEDDTATDMLNTMINQFSIVAGELEFVARAQAIGVDPYDAVTIASILEREVSNPDDAADAAQVIYNRLEIGQKLEMDSTVKYANGLDGLVTTTDEDRANPSPYNTYYHTGLPPGAIANPGRWALEAAVNPSEGDYLYFVTVNLSTGETKFTNSYEEHLQNQAEFQRWCQANPGNC